MQNDLLYPLSEQFFICLCLWVPIFCVSSIITYTVTPSSDIKTNKDISSSDISNLVFNCFFVTSMVLTPLYLYEIMKIVTMFDTTDLLYNLRILAVHGDNDFGVLKYSYIINQVLFVVAMWQYPKVPIWKIVLITIACLIVQFALMEKNGIFFLAIATLLILYQKGVLKLRSIVITFGIIVFLFFLINMSKEIKSDDSYENMTFVDFLGIYILSPSVAFGYVTEDLSNQFGSNTFQYFYHILNNLGMGDYEVNQRLQEYVWVPLPTNVYTIFQPFYEDFKYWGVAFFAFLYGTIMGFTYRIFKNGVFLAACVYTYFAKVLVVQFYHEDFILCIAMFVQYLILIMIIQGFRSRFIIKDIF